jgi:clan AA aspartic protease (TIGR02281 family)
MGRFRAFLTVLAALVALLPGRLRADQDGALKTLEDKGLKRSFSNFALPEETDFSKQMRATEALKKKLLDAQHEAVEATKKVDDKKKTIIAYLQQRRELRAQVDMARNVAEHNKMVNAMNELGDRIMLMQQSEAEEKAMTAARTAANKLTEQYVEQILQLRQLYDKVKAKYDALAADAEVTQAIDEFNKDADKKLALGPTSGFTAAGRKLKNLEKVVLSESINLRRGPGGLWYVSVVFNGKYAEEMAIDTGASIIALPAKMAKDAGLTPAADAPTMQLTMADGHTVQGRMIYADKVRVGKFTAEHVECSVLPAEFSEAAPLLGLSFWRNFIFKIDNEKAKLVMSKIDVPEKSGPTPRGRKASAE